MNLVRREIEVTGATIEKAVAEGLEKLGLSRSEVVVDIIDEGSRGILGLGSRDAVVMVKEITPTGEPEDKKPKPVLTKPVQTKPEQAPTPALPSDEDEEVPVAQKEADKAASTLSQSEETEDSGEAANEDELLQKERAVALEVVSSLLDKMQVKAEVTPSVSEPDDLTGRRMNVLQINGEDLGILIGPRGETLSALQYIARLMVGHQIHQRANFTIDVEGYRQRREKALRRLAERMAGKVIKRNRAMTLEPMPPNERRIIHMTLRHHDQVQTQSVGEGKRRKVRIELKSK